MLLLRTFGGLSVENAVFIGGAAARRRPLAVLAILAVAGQRGIGRDKLIGLLWPESEQERARNSLSQAITVVRRELGVDELVLGSVEPRLNPAVITSDVGEFDRALDAGEPQRAVALYTGPFLDGVFLKNAPEFERWVDQERTRLAHRQAHALEELAAAAAERGDRREAVTWWRRRVVLEPTSTAATTGLVRALIDAGDREGAIRQAQTYAALVRAELDAEPDPALMRLVEQLRAAPASVPPGIVASGRGADARSTVAEGGDAAAMPVVPAPAVMPAEAGIQGPSERLDTRLGRLPCIPGQPARGHDDPTSPAASAVPAEVGTSVHSVVPAEAVTQGMPRETLDSRVRGNDDPASLAAPILVRRVRRRRLAWAAALALGALVAIGVTYAYATRPRAEPKLVIVPPFENQTGDSALAAVGSMAADWVRQGLAQTGLVEVVDAGAILADAKGKAGGHADAGEQRWRAVAGRAGAQMIVYGSVARAHDSLIVQARVVRASDGKVLSEGDPVAGAAADPRGVMEAMRQRVMGAFAALEDPRFARWQKVILQPPRHDAYEEFAAGFESVNQNRPRMAFTHFLAAARLDTSFVQAKLRAAMEAWETGDDSIGALADSLISAARAQRDRLSPFDRAAVDYLTAEQSFGREGALAAARRMTQVAPSDIGALVRHAGAAMFTNRFDEALGELHRADRRRAWVRADHDYWNWENLVHHYAGDYAGELAEAARCQEICEAADVPYPRYAGYALWALAALGREASVDSLIAISLASPNNAGAGSLYLTAGIEYHAHGHHDAERRAFARARAWYEERMREYPEQPAGARNALVLMDWNLGNWAALRDAWTAQMTAHPGEMDARGYGQLGAAAAHRGDTATARAMIQRIGELKTAPKWGKPMWQAIVTAALGDRGRAMVLLEDAMSYGYSPLVNGHQQPGLDPLRSDPAFQALLRPRR